MVSSARIGASLLPHTCQMISMRRVSMSPTRTRRRYFGRHMTSNGQRWVTLSCNLLSTTRHYGLDLYGVSPRYEMCEMAGTSNVS